MSTHRPRTIAYGALPCGPTWEERVTLADRLAAERTARAQGLSPEATPQAYLAVLSWHTATRAGIIDLPLPQALSTALDMSCDLDQTTEEPAGPTVPAQPTS